MPEPDDVLHRLRSKTSGASPMVPTGDDIRALHAEHVTRYGRLARQSTRTEVHGILQLLRPCPTEVPEGGAYRPGDLDMLQKHWGEDLWAEAESLVTLALGKDARR